MDSDAAKNKAFCEVCTVAKNMGAPLPSTTHDQESFRAFVWDGFSSWAKALQRFSKQDWTILQYWTITRHCQGVGTWKLLQTNLKNAPLPGATHSSSRIKEWWVTKQQIKYLLWYCLRWYYVLKDVLEWFWIVDLVHDLLLFEPFCYRLCGCDYFFPGMSC